MLITETPLVSLPTHLCGCRVDRILLENQTYLATGPGGRSVVLKTLDPDCLVRGSLHPHVRDRLSRVREVAHASVANLFGVERKDGIAYLMWEYVEGLTFDVYAGANRTPREVAQAAREAVLAVDLLHMQGIIHGALIPSNVLVATNGTVRLTHISPLLYTDPAVDIDCMWNMLELAAEQLGDRGRPLAKMVDEGRKFKWTLRQLASRLSALIDTREPKKDTAPETDQNHSSRRRTMVGAAWVIVAGAVLAWSAWFAAQRGYLGSSDNPHVLFRSDSNR